MTNTLLTLITSGGVDANDVSITLRGVTVQATSGCSAGAAVLVGVKPRNRLLQSSTSFRVTISFTVGSTSAGVTSAVRDV